MRDETVRLALPAAGEATERPISLAIVAMGGQGGGVLTDWIVQLAENHGWVAQSTSVPGVAQRTGATIYYIEAMPPLDGRKPILSLMPTPGDVDVVMAAEFMEAGRSILRGLVTPDRTTLIASNHRSFAIGEKIAPGNGIADGGAVTGAIGIAAKTEIIFDLNALAIAHGSVISAAMFGALAAAAVLPFSRDSYLDVIRAGGKGAKASIETFEAAFDRVKTGAAEVAAPAQAKQADPLSRNARSGSRRPRRKIESGAARACAHHGARWPEEGGRLPGRRLWRRISRHPQDVVRGRPKCRRWCPDLSPSRKPRQNILPTP